MTQQSSKGGRRAAKKAKFSQIPPTRKRKLVPLIGAGLVIVLGGLALFATGRSTGGDAPSVSTTAEATVALPLSDLENGEARFYDYKTSAGRKVRFFAVKAVDGVYRAALDACDVCYRYKKGYFQRGDSMICRKCGQSFDTTLINEVAGGCNPIGLDTRIAGDSLVVQARDLDRGASYF